MAETIAAAPSLTARQASGRIVADQVRFYGRHERAARRGDPEAVHQMRVATRRLRAAIRLFKSALETRKRVSKGLRWIARRLGRVRDHDVMIALLEERHLGALGGREAARLKDLVAGLKERRFAAHQRVARGFGRNRYGRLRAALGEWATRPRFEGGEDVMAARHLSDEVEELGRAVLGEPGMEDLRPTPEELHRLRIAFKRLRYVLDFHAETCGLAYEVERALARRMQECLGELHDHDLLLGWLERGEDFFAGPWPTLVRRLSDDRQRLFRRFLRLRKQWRDRTRPEPTVAPLAEPRFVSLEPAPVVLRLVTGHKEVASTMIR